jgi:hypothetical protein
MAWIESHQSLSRHKKTLRLCAELKTDRHKVLGHLHELWWWGLDNADTYGAIGHTSNEVLAEAAGWPLSKAESWVGALVHAGFIDATDDGLVLHDWYDYAGKLNEQRSRNKERMRRKRDGAQPPHDPSTNGTRAAHVQRTSGARAPATRARITQPDRTIPNQVTPLNPPLGDRTAVRKPKRERKTITDDDIEQLVAKYAEQYGNRQSVRDEIDQALNHNARFKSINERLYVDGWLRRELQHRPGWRVVGGRGSTPARNAVDRTGVAN